MLYSLSALNLLSISWMQLRRCLVKKKGRKKNLHKPYNRVLHDTSLLKAQPSDQVHKSSR